MQIKSLSERQWYVLCVFFQEHMHVPTIYYLREGSLWEWEVLAALPEQ